MRAGRAVDIAPATERRSTLMRGHRCYFAYVMCAMWVGVAGPGCSLPRSPLGQPSDAAIDAPRDDGGLDGGVDAGLDGGDDVGPADGGMDAGPFDVGPPDTGALDAGPPDTGAPDAACAPFPTSLTATLTIDAASVLTGGGFVRVHYSGFSGTTGDYIELSVPCEPGSAPPRYWTYTASGSTSGTVDLLIPMTLAAGTYQARGLFQDSYVVATVSPSFHIGP
jgi:hypothetical protein